MKITNRSLISDPMPVILAGGKGTRLQSVVADRPKALAPIAGRPFIEYLLDSLAAENFGVAIISIGYMADTVRESLGNSYKNTTLIYVEEDEPLGTGGALRLVAKQNFASSYLILNGDSLITASYRDFYKNYLEDRCRAGILLYRSDDCSRYGTVIKDEKSSRIIQFMEKTGDKQAGLISSGVYLIDQLLLDTIPEERAVSLEKELFPYWVNEDLLKGFISPADFFIDIGTPQSFTLAQELFCSAYFQER